MMAIDFKAQAEALRDELIARRRDFHAHPELAFEEFRTAGIVAQELQKLGLEVRTGVGKTGVIGLLEGGREGQTILVRADMDALPILEENQTDFTSSVPNKMHACGHDGHTAIALGVAKLLSQHRDEIAGTIKFVFQPGEEVGRGAQAMVDDGALEDPRPDVTVGLHLWNSMPVGKVGVADGSTMAGASIFDIKVTGKGTHGALPHVGIDPVVCAAQIVTALQTIVSRSSDPLDTLVVSVTQIRAGDAYNVIPQFAELHGTVRYFRNETRDLARERMREIAVNVGFAMRCEVEVNFVDLTIPVINNAEVGAKLRPLFAEMLGADNLDTTARTMGAEDVSLFMNDIPGFYFFVGAQDMTADAYYGHHHPKFSIDENSLPLAVALLSQAVAAYVLPE
ncbi:MAG: amidohydrolase [Anaerolineae bacterium]|uniref:M20 metallopeptidase family protein n=1 Tax=Candidatus Flexifilum breve TaxID=3140694 RepID=UPI001AC7D5F4|nr:amidohydrolase [Chloroflexota bacterium]MBK9751115.1 amidohydrolase [Chloroflexota bacterium]MBN8639657.1 amidohydrolase [Anaerolineae bacterium]